MQEVKREIHALVRFMATQRGFEPCAKALSAQINALRLPASTKSECDFASMARYLKIRVRENGRTKVKLTQSVSNIDNLVGLLDEVMKQRIERQGIDLAQIVTDVRRQGNAPTQGFELIEGSKHIEVFQSRHDRNLRDWLGLFCSPRFSTRVQTA